MVDACKHGRDGWCYECTIRNDTEQFHKALEELEKAGWPCRLSELPALYLKVCGELNDLKIEEKALKAKIVQLKKIIFDAGVDYHGTL